MVSWGGGRAWVPLDQSVHNITLFREDCFVREVCMQSGSAFFLVAVLGLVVLINYIFELFVVWGGFLHLTSHTAIFNLSFLDIF